MQKAFTFKDKDGKLVAGHLETTDEMYRRIIINEENIPLLIVKGYAYHHATPYYGTIPILADTWKDIIPLTNEKRRILVLGDKTGAQTLGLLLTYGYHEESKIFYCNPFGHPDEKGSRDHDAMEALTSKTLRITGLQKKVNVYPEYARNFLPTLKRGILDIVFVDLNNEARWLLEDLVLVWRKVKTGGFVIINGCTVESKKVAIQGFLESYKGTYKIIGVQNDQMFLLKTEVEEVLVAVEGPNDIHDEGGGSGNGSGEKN